MSVSKAARMALFLARMKVAPPAASAEEARILVNQVLDTVEDEFSGIPYDPAAAMQLVSDGRMYGPHPRFASTWKDRVDLARYAHTSHDTFIQANGAILIRRRRPATILLSRPGADGQEVQL